jgi:hypothetical protein
MVKEIRMNDDEHNIPREIVIKVKIYKTKISLFKKIFVFLGNN